MRHSCVFMITFDWTTQPMDEIHSFSVVVCGPYLRAEGRVRHLLDWSLKQRRKLSDWPFLWWMFSSRVSLPFFLPFYLTTTFNSRFKGHLFSSNVSGSVGCRHLKYFHILHLPLPLFWLPTASYHFPHLHYRPHDWLNYNLWVENSSLLILVFTPHLWVSALHTFLKTSYFLSRNWRHVCWKRETWGGPGQTQN